MYVETKIWDAEQLKQIACLQKVCIERPQLGSAVNAIVNHYLVNQDGDDHGYFLLTGETGSGKTTVLARAMEKINALCEGKSVCPIGFFSLPENPTRKDFMSKCLEAVGDPAAHTGTRTAMEQRFHKAAAKKGVRVMIVNEIQHLVNSDDKEVNYVAADLLKLFCEGFRRPVILAGLPEALTVFQSNCQLPGRRHGAVALRLFSLATAVDIEECQLALRNYDESLPFPDYCMLADPDQMVVHMEACDVNPRRMTRLTKHAGASAIAEGKRRIEADHWRSAWTNLFGDLKPGKRNPYDGFVVPRRRSKA